IWSAAAPTTKLATTVPATTAARTRPAWMGVRPDTARVAPRSTAARPYPNARPACAVRIHRASTVFTPTSSGSPGPVQGDAGGSGEPDQDRFFDLPFEQ